MVGREESGIVILGTESASHIMKLWCKKSFDWSGFLIFPPISETFWGCITVHLQFRRQADLALSSHFFSNKTTGVNSWENNGPRSESGKKKNAITPWTLYLVGRGVLSTDILFTVPLLQGRFKIIEHSKFILHYFHEWKENTIVHCITFVHYCV